MPPQAFTLDRLFALRRAYNRSPIAVCPRDRLIAVTVQGAHEDHLKEETFTTDTLISGELLGARVILVDRETGGASAPFGQGRTAWSPRWSPEGDRLAAWTAGPHRAALSVWDRRTGRVRDYTAVPAWARFGFKMPLWLPDGRSVIFQRRRETAAGFAAKVSRHAPGGPAPAAVPPVADLIRLDLDSGEEVVLVEGLWEAHAQMAPSGRRLAVMNVVGGETRKTWTSLWELIVMDADGANRRVVHPGIEDNWGLGFCWSPDERHIAWQSTPTTGGAGRFWCMALEGQAQPVELPPAECDAYAPRHFEAVAWTPDGRMLIPGKRKLHVYSPGGAHLREIAFAEDVESVQWLTSPPARDPDGAARLLLCRNAAGRHSVHEVDLATLEAPLVANDLPAEAVGSTRVAAPDGKAWYFCAAGDDYSLTLKRGSIDAPAAGSVHVACEGFRGLALGEVRALEWRAPSGRACKGAVLLPPGHVQGAPAPAIVNVYLGATSAGRISHACSSAMLGTLISPHLLSARGYAVLYLDLPVEKRDPMSQIPGLVMAGVNRAVEEGLIDPARLGVMGNSYGGYTVLALIAQSRAFRAAIAGAPTVELTDVSPWTIHGQANMGGTLWERPLDYVANSPLFYLDRAVTPLMLVSGDADVWSTRQAGKAYAALEHLDKTAVEFRSYPGEGHHPMGWTTSAQRDLYERAVAWFDEHVMA